MFHVEHHMGGGSVLDGRLFHVEHSAALRDTRLELVPRGTNVDHILVPAS